MTNKEKQKKLLSEIEELIDEKDAILNSNINEDGTRVIVNFENTIKLQGLNMKIKSVTEQIAELSEIIYNEDRMIAGYTVFCNSIDEDEKYVLCSRIIPFHLKEKFINEFNVLNSTMLPNISSVEQFLINNR